MIGIVGGYGQVGRVAAAYLRAVDAGQLRIGGRRKERAVQLAEDLGDAEGWAVDVSDLADFCAGCEVILNCAGPSAEVGTAVARAAAAAGASYVDAAGDEPLRQALCGLPWPSNHTAVVSAGMMPGLSGLLPQFLAADTGFQGEALTAYIGGCDTFSEAAASDYLRASADGFGEPFAAWRNGFRVRRALNARSGLQVPFFPNPVHVLPYLSTETEWLAKRLGLTDVDWYSAFDGDLTYAALSGDAAGLCRAAEADTFGRVRYQLLVFSLTGPTGARTLICRGTNASSLTGTAAGLAVTAVTSGKVGAGVWHLAEVLDPAWAVQRLRQSAAVTAFEILAVGVGAGAGAEEEGEL
ncbi:MAG TPA: saccharopine dehydrogenase NADP-binding domain-containing protein [Streptosporangiaceae bacterium]|nr:saccharopine dehydrogenase NADP-binding domain-containing protein [Streptosporangiaceae bacterium]